MKVSLYLIGLFDLLSGLKVMLLHFFELFLKFITFFCSMNVFNSRWADRGLVGKKFFVIMGQGFGFQKKWNL